MNIFKTAEVLLRARKLLTNEIAYISVFFNKQGEIFIEVLGKNQEEIYLSTSECVRLWIHYLTDILFIAAGDELEKDILRDLQALSKDPYFLQSSALESLCGSNFKLVNDVPPESEEGLLTQYTGGEDDSTGAIRMTKRNFSEIHVLERRSIYRCLPIALFDYLILKVRNRTTNNLDIFTKALSLYLSHYPIPSVSNESGFLTKNAKFEILDNIRIYFNYYPSPSEKAFDVLPRLAKLAILQKWAVDQATRITYQLGQVSSLRSSTGRLWEELTAKCEQVIAAVEEANGIVKTFQIGWEVLYNPFREIANLRIVVGDGGTFFVKISSDQEISDMEYIRLWAQYVTNLLYFAKGSELEGKILHDLKILLSAQHLVRGAFFSLNISELYRSTDFSKRGFVIDWKYKGRENRRHGQFRIEESSFRKRDVLERPEMFRNTQIALLDYVIELIRYNWKAMKALRFAIEFYLHYYPNPGEPHELPLLDGRPSLPLSWLRKLAVDFADEYYKEEGAQLKENCAVCKKSGWVPLHEDRKAQLVFIDKTLVDTMLRVCPACCDVYFHDKCSIYCPNCGRKFP